MYIASSAGLEIHPIGGSATTHPGATSAVSAHPGSNGDIVAFGSGRKVSLAEVTGGSVKVNTEFEDNRGDVLALAFSPDGGLLVAGDVRRCSVLVQC